MSPFFSENLEDTPSNIRKFWEERGKMEGFKNISYQATVGRWEGPTAFLYGTKETPFLRASVDVIKEKFQDSWIVKIKGVGHDIANPLYTLIIQELLRPPDH